MQRSLRNYIRLYHDVVNHNHPIKDYTDVDTATLGGANMDALHDMVRKEDKYCAYSTYQVSVLTDENGLEHRSAPINESRMVKFGEIKKAEDITVKAYTGWIMTDRIYADLFPDTRGKMMVVCGRSISPREPDDIICDRATGKRIWPVPAPRMPKMEP